jgi:hypothetical protein
MKIYTMNFNLLTQNKWLRRAGGLVTAVAALWLASWVLVPWLVKDQIEVRLGEQLGRQVTVGRVEFRPWSLELTVHQLAIARAAGAVDSLPQVAVERLYINAELQSLVRLAPVVDALTVEAPQLNLTHLGEGRYDVDDVLARLAQKDLSKPEVPDAEPLKFALYNLVLSQGTVNFTDAAVNQMHELRDLQLQLPFLSNLDSQRTVSVEPKLAFSLNGSRFESSAQATPFDPTRKTQAVLKLADLDLAPYLAYVPASLPVRLASAKLNADLTVVFEQSAQALVKLTGTLQASQVSVLNKSSQELLGFEQLKLKLADVQPLVRVVHVAEVELVAPRLAVGRSAAGQLDWLALVQPRNTPEKIATQATGAGANDLDDVKNDWSIKVDQLSLNGGQVDWVDAVTTPVARLGLSELMLQATGMVLPWAQPMQWQGEARLVGRSAADNAVPPSRLRFKGSATDQMAQVDVEVDGLPLSLAAPYMAQHLAPRLAGTLQAALRVDWAASTDGLKPDTLQIQASELTVNDITLTQGKSRLASLKQLALSKVSVGVGPQTVTVGQLRLTQPQATVTRDAQRRWMVDDWLQSPPDKAPAAKPWAVALNEVQVRGGTMVFQDNALARPVAFEVSGLSLTLKNVSTTGTQPWLAQLSTQIRHGDQEPGRLGWQGSVALSPLKVQGKVDVVRLPVHAFEPYWAEAVNLDLRRADASFKGQMSYADSAAGPVVMVKGDTVIEDFQSSTRLPGADPAAPSGASPAPADNRRGEELLSWKVLSLRGGALAMAPGTATTADVGETVLSDFFARLILDERGRLNLQEVAQPEAPVKTDPDTPESIATSAYGTGATAIKDVKAALPAVIRFGPVSLQGGRVDFSDRFIKPSYSTQLTELQGTLSAFSSQAQPDGGVLLADLALRGRAEGTASLEIVGKVNPLATPLALDITGKVRDLELPPLSMYAVRHAGHGIERGKLSVDVGYLIKPDGQLTASNNIVLNQLVFGDKVEGAPASLPVKLAVALLADRNGVIDINLPVSGSLNDPQFRLAPIVFKLIINLVAKAITAPFSLLASALGGGGDELSQVSFAPGSARLTPEATQGLDKVVGALSARPTLKMTVVGTASLSAEAEGYRRERLTALVQAEKRRVAVVSPTTGVAGAAKAGPDDAVTAIEYPIFLKAAYKRADFAKPRNLVGLAKDLPVADMETLLLSHFSVTEDAMRALAVQRGVAVRDYLASRQLPLERLFLGAAKAVSPAADWQPRAELNLSAP